MRYSCTAISAALLLACVSPAAAEDEPLWSLSSSVNYSVGDYGTGKDTTFIYVPFTLGVKPIDGFTLGLTIPYVYQTGQTVVITGGGVAVRKDKQRQLGTATQNQVTSTEHGLGDVLLKGQYVLVEEKSVLPEVAPYLKIKFPTADQGKGLGTGEFDETVGVDLSKTLFPRFVSYVTLAYTVIGSPEQDAVSPIRQLRHARLHGHWLASRYEPRQLLRLECGCGLSGRPPVLGLRVPRRLHRHFTGAGESS